MARGIVGYRRSIAGPSRRGVLVWELYGRRRDKCREEAAHEVRARVEWEMLAVKWLVQEAPARLSLQ